MVLFTLTFCSSFLFVLDRQTILYIFILYYLALYILQLIKNGRNFTDNSKGKKDWN